MRSDVADTSTAHVAVIAGHQITGTLGRDRTGAAFRAVAPDGTPVILRVRKPARAALARLQAHAEALGGLSHPAIPRVTGFGEVPEGFWVATAEVEGAGLRRLIADGLAPMRAVRLLGEVADALDAAHEAGLVHGDVRPGNVIVQGRPVERAVLVGFEPGPTVTREDRGPYAAPELRSGAEPRGAADVFGLAAVLRECLEASGAELPPAVRAPLERGLDPDPARRYSSAGELMAEVARTFVDSGPGASAPAATPDPAPAAAPPTPAPAPAPAPARAPAEPSRRGSRRMLGTVAAVIVVAGAAAAGYAMSRTSSTDEEPAAPREASADGMTIVVPDGWSRTASRNPGAPELAGGLSLVRDDPAARIVVGVAEDRGAALDPSRLAGERARPRQVRLGALSALRFDSPGGRGPAVLYAASTSAGTPVVACTGPAVAEPCAGVAKGLSLRGARGYDPVAGIAWKNGLAADTRRLRSRRAAGLRRLRRARTPGGQARAANALAAMHASAARRVRRADTPPQAASARRRVLARLLSIDRAYRSLARAARAGDRAAFARARSRVRRADRRLRVTLRSL